MNALKKYLQDLLSKFDNQKIKDLEEKFKNYFKTKPNGFLGDIPLFVIDTSYSQDNEVTEYKSYLNRNFNENMFINNYTLQINIHVYGKNFKQDLEKLIKLSRERMFTAFLYTKFENKVYAPVVITQISYDEDFNNKEYIDVKIGLKEVTLLEFKTENGVTTTNVYTPNNSTVQNSELEDVSLNQTMKDLYNNDSRTGGIAV